MNAFSRIINAIRDAVQSALFILSLAIAALFGAVFLLLYWLVLSPILLISCFSPRLKSTRKQAIKEFWSALKETVEK